MSRHRDDHPRDDSMRSPWWQNQTADRHAGPLDPEQVKAMDNAMREAFNNCTKGSDATDPPFPQDATAASSVLGDTCPRCGGQLDYDEVDIGVGTLRGNPGCPDCHWVPGRVADPVCCPRCGTPGDQDDCSECHPTRPRS